MLLPAQLRSLLSPSVLNWSQGILADELGWTGDNATLRISRYERDGAEIPLTTAKHILRIAREHGYELRSGHWQKTS